MGNREIRTGIKKALHGVTIRQVSAEMSFTLSLEGWGQLLALLQHADGLEVHKIAPDIEAMIQDAAAQYGQTVN